jgi:glycerate dehydrogenase
MKIVVLDGFTLNPGDLSWDALKELGQCEIHERSAPDQLLPRLRSAEATLTNKVVLNRELIKSLPDLRYIGVTATGFNIVDVAAARECGVTVTNVPAYGTDSVAQATMALLLELTNHVGHHAKTVRDGRWSDCPDFCYWDYPLIELAGLTLGIIGYGRIGQQVGRIAQAFGMNVIATVNKPKALEPGVWVVNLETLLRESDVVTLHCPLTAETKGLINRERIALMKPSAFLLNTSRGPLIVEEDLARALREERIAGAGLDVLSIEPPPKTNPLFTAPNCLITPHQAWATRAARQRLMRAAVENLKHFQAGTPKNVVS